MDEVERLDQIMSVRVSPDLSVRLRKHANDNNLKASDVIRIAVERYLGTSAIGWRCEHLEFTCLPGVLGKPTVGCGCDMWPVFETSGLSARTKAMKVA